MQNSTEHQAALARAVLTSAIDFAIVTTNLAGEVTSWNPGAEALLGWSEEEMKGEHACRFFTPEDKAAGRCELEMAVARDEGRCEDERWHLKKDGSRLWASGLMMRFESERTGEHIGYLKILRDRTPQHEANEQMRESERQYRSLTEALPGFVFTTDAAGRNTYTNDFYQEYTGRGMSELAGDGWTDSVHPDDRTASTHDWRSSVDGGHTYTSTMRFARHDGAYRTFSCRALPQRDASGAITRWIGTCIDVEELREAEARLVYEKGLLDAVVNQAPVGISIAHVGDTPPVFSTRLHAILGHGPGGMDEERYATFGALRDDGTSYAPAEYPTVRALTNGERIDRELMRYRVKGKPDGDEDAVRRLEVTSGPVRGRGRRHESSHRR